MNTTFTVMPSQTNYLGGMIFGGAFFSQMDLAAATAVDELLSLNSSECDSAVTHKADVTFHKPTYVGDMIGLSTNVVEVRTKAIVIHVKALRKQRNKLSYDFVAEGTFVFVSRKGEKYYPHGIPKKV